MSRPGRKQQTRDSQPLSQSIPDLFRSGSRSKMAAPHASSHAEHSEEEGQHEAEEELSPAAMFKNIKLLFQTELAKAVSDFTAQLQELAQRVSDGEAKLDALTDTVEDDRRDLDEHATQLQQLELKIEDLENRSRRANLRIRGLPESTVDVTKAVTALFYELAPHLEPEMLRFDRIHRALTKPKNPELPRDVVLKLHYSEVRDVLLRAARTLPALPGVPPSVHLYSDLAPSTLARRREFRPVTLALQREDVRYRWGFPFSLSFQLNGRSHLVRSLAEATEALRREKIELAELPLQQKAPRPTRTWTPVSRSRRAAPDRGQPDLPP